MINFKQVQTTLWKQCTDRSTFCRNLTHFPLLYSSSLINVLEKRKAGLCFRNWRPRYWGTSLKSSRRGICRSDTHTRTPIKRLVGRRSFYVEKTLRPCLASLGGFSRIFFCSAKAIHTKKLFKWPVMHIKVKI